MAQAETLSRPRTPPDERSEAERANRPGASAVFTKNTYIESPDRSRTNWI